MWFKRYVVQKNGSSALLGPPHYAIIGVGALRLAPLRYPSPIPVSYNVCARSPMRRVAGGEDLKGLGGASDRNRLSFRRHLLSRRLWFRALRTDTGRHAERALLEAEARQGQARHLRVRRNAYWLSVGAVSARVLHLCAALRRLRCRYRLHSLVGGHLPAA